MAKLLAGGITEAFEVVKVLYGNGVEKPCHYSLHALGEEAYRLYALSGKNDFMITEGSFCNYGFYHGVVIGLFREGGDVKKAKNFCDALNPTLLKERPDVQNQCYHGIGHGLITELLKSSETDKTDSIQVRRTFKNAAATAVRGCRDQLLTEEESNNCLSGIFHELALLQTERGWYSDKENPLWLCQEMNTEDRGFCYGNMHRVFFKIHPDINAESLVPTIVKTYGENREIIGGIIHWYGYYILMPKNSPETALANCRRIASPYQTFCIRAVVTKLSENGTPGKEYETAALFCGLKILTSAEKIACTDESWNYFKRIYSEKQLKKICETYPILYQSFCRPHP